MTYSLYCVEWKSPAPDQRIQQHVRAASEESAIAKIKARWADADEIIEVTILRPCNDREINAARKAGEIT